MTILKMRHFAILGIAAVTVTAMFTNTSLTDIIPFYGIMSAIIVGDKANEMKNGVKPK